jgi:fructokinase
MMLQTIAGIEAGGTKILCALAAPDGRILAQARVPTGDPDTTFAGMAAFFDEQRRRHGFVRSGGIASFGPLDLDHASPGFGQLTTTPKPGWAAVDMRGRIADLLNAPVAIDTDVQCAAMAEAEAGTGQGLDRLCYVTVGTGIGIGYVERDRSTAGTAHLEAGHIRVPRASGDAAFAGTCPYHGDCLEGLASGPAMAARWSMGAEHLSVDHVGWEYEAHYIASLCVTLAYTLRPNRIVLGGGVMDRTGMHDRVRRQFVKQTAGYALDRWSAVPETFIARPTLTDPSPGLVGALLLARTVQSNAE